MEYKGKPCVVEAWDASGAEVKAHFDVSVVTTEFQMVLTNQLTKKGIAVEQTSPNAQVVVRGRFVRIDEGNRFLRYLLPFLAGKAVVKVEGELIVNGRQAASLSATAKESWGLFGGGSKGLLKLCAKSCAKKVAKQVLAGLKQS